ncbi:hypothetical protein [Amycolatopsis dongchuanensis]|uniref:hypothetical protein n=1 Tax=Amycolatopsis dongchuanensis TaxID=1070866 RepID=UPI0031F8D09A
MDPAGALVRLITVLLNAPPVEPPKLDVPAAIRGLEVERIHRAPGAVAWFDEQAVSAALAPDMKVLVTPFQGGNYPGSDQHYTEVDRPLREWADRTGTTLIEVEGLSVSATSGGGFGPSDLPELRQLTSHYDVTGAVLGMINYAKTGAKSVPSPPADPVVPPSAEQVAALTARLRENPVYVAPGRTDPIDVPVGLLAEKTGIRARVVAFPALGPDEPLVDYAPALAEEFPGETVFVSYGAWLDVAGPDQQILESARDYAYGRYEYATFARGVNLADRIGTVATRVADLVHRNPFARPAPPAFDLRHRIANVAPWVLLGSAVLLGGGALLAWSRHRVLARQAEEAALRKETALTAAELAELDAGLLAVPDGPSERLAAAAERQSTARELFERAGSAEAMREVREIAAQGRKLLAGAR